MVLPAPLGPIRPTILPSGTAKLTSWTARSPRKDFEMFRTSSISALQAELPGERRPDAVRQEHDDEEQADAVEDLLHARDVDAERQQQLAHALGEPGEQQRAD